MKRGMLVLLLALLPAACVSSGDAMTDGVAIPALEGRRSVGPLEPLKGFRQVDIRLWEGRFRKSRLDFVAPIYGKLRKRRGPGTRFSEVTVRALAGEGAQDGAGDAGHTRWALEFRVFDIPGRIVRDEHYRAIIRKERSGAYASEWYLESVARRWRCRNAGGGGWTIKRCR